MPRQASGAYTAPANTAAVSGQTILSTAYNMLQTDQGNEIGNSLDRNGRGGMRAALDMGGYKITNAADPVADDDLVTLGYADTKYLSSDANSVTNDKLAVAPVGTVKGVPSAAATATAAATISIATPAVVTWTAHGLAEKTPVTFQTTGALPGGLAVNTIYYVLSPGTNTFRLSATPGGAALNTTGTQSGTHTAYAYATGGETDLTMPYLGQLVTPGIPLPSFAVNLQINNNSATPDTKVDVSCDAATVGGATGNGRHSGVAVTINLTTTGANALDTGTLAASTWYYIFLISTGTTVAGLASKNLNPSLPATYLYSVRLGAMQTDASSKLYRTRQVGTKAQYVVTASSNTASLWMLSNASIGSVTFPTYNAVPVRGANRAAPNTATRVSLVVSSYGGVGSILVAPNGDYGAYNAVTNPPPFASNAVNAALTGEIVLESSSIYVASSNGTTSAVLASGWYDPVPAV